MSEPVVFELNKDIFGKGGDEDSLRDSCRKRLGQQSITRFRKAG